ncbi:MAG: DUF3465 domain-containing protein [Bdellovibrionota bacterium]
MRKINLLSIWVFLFIANVSAFGHPESGIRLDPPVEDASPVTGAPAINCPAYGQNLQINNKQVLHWKRTTQNQFRERGHISGMVVEIFPDRNGHEHFVVNIGSYFEDTIEVIYNQDFGALPGLKIGMRAEACGDYITSIAQSGPYPPSPVGGIIHWVHKNPSRKGHDPGFLILDGKIYGQDMSKAGEPLRP